jgi:membrane protease YdiL (CAAX protease family)
MLGGLLSFLPMLQLVGWKDIFNTDSAKLIDRLLVPAHASTFRLMQFISTLFIFFVPAWLYAWVCHSKPAMHLGLKARTPWKQQGVVIMMMMVALPIVGSLQEITTQLPWSTAMLEEFKLAEKSYNKQIAVIARMDNVVDLLISLGMVAALPAIFEEILFRGALQNLFTRWMKNPIVAIIVTAILFSAVHGSALGFLSRILLGIILGWIYYRSGNLWLSIIGHFVNNAIAILALYSTKKAGEVLDPSKIDTHYPVWIGAIGVIALIGFSQLFERMLPKQSPDDPVELPMQGKGSSDPI